MALTFQQLKAAVRQHVFPQGEARNLRDAHDKSILDALVDLQRWVECLQSNNTHLIPHCSTFYNCGLTSFDFPRARIKRLSVIDKINPETHKEDPDAADDWCSEIEYRQIDACHIRGYLGKTPQVGGCFPFFPFISEFFAIPRALCGNKFNVPVATDEDVPPGLPVLRLGYHYPQTSTDSSTGRAAAGVWAIDGGRVYVAPWIQSTETVVIKWDGIKRDWSESDLVDDDPTLLRAVELYLRWEHARDWDENPTMAAGYEVEYRKALQELWYDCDEENRVRSCESEREGAASGARGIAGGVGGDGGGGGFLKLYYNQALPPVLVTCPGDQTGTSVSIPIPADWVSSPDGVQAANDLAVKTARELGLQQLHCVDSDTVYPNPAVSQTATCPNNIANTPDAVGPEVTITVPAGTEQFNSTISTDDAKVAAEQWALAKAQSLLVCTFYNRAISKHVPCPAGTTGSGATGAATEKERSYMNAFPGETGGQSKADALGETLANDRATAQLSSHCTNIGPPVRLRYCNVGLHEFFHFDVNLPPWRPGYPKCGPKTITISVSCPSRILYRSTQTLADNAAKAACQAAAGDAYFQQLSKFALTGQCPGSFSVALNFPRYSPEECGETF